MSTRRRIGRTTEPRFEVLESRSLLSASSVDVDHSVLNRRYIDAMIGEPEPGESDHAALRGWLAGRLDRGANRVRVVYDLARTLPATEAAVRLAFAMVLDRVPTAREMGFGRSLLQGGGDAHDLIKVLAASDEYFHRFGGGTSDGYAQAVARLLLGRAATEAEMTSWGRLATSARGRRMVTASIAEGLEFRRNAAEAELTDLGREPTSSELSRATRLLAAPGGLPRLQAHVLGSGSAFAMLTRDEPTAPPPSPGPGDVQANPPGFPLGIGPAFTSSSYQFTTFPPGWGSAAYVYAASYDGGLFAGGPSGLYTYDASSLAWAFVGPGDPMISVSAVSASEVWTVEHPVGGAPVLGHYLNGAGMTVPDLPADETPGQVAAGADGTVWVLAGDNSVLALASDGSGWTPVLANLGLALGSISVGSADNIWAIGYVNGQPVPFRWTDEVGWTQDPSFPAATVDSIDATSDGGVWATAGGATYVLPVGGAWYPVNATSLPAAPTAGLAAISQLQALAASPGGLSVATIGLVDQQPAIPFPGWTPGQDAAYDYISEQLGVTVEGGLRTQYANSYASVDGWADQIATMAIPATITQADWDAVVAQLDKEFGAVEDVTNVFSTVNTVTTDIASEVVDVILPGIVANLNASNPGSNTSAIVDIVLEGLIEAVLWGISAGIGGVGAVIGSVVASGFGTAVSAIQATNGGPDDGVETAYADFSTMISNFFTAMNTANASYADAIYPDYGKLLAVAAQVDGGVWSVNDQQEAAAVAAALPPFEVYFYQALLPSQWKIVDFTYKRSLYSPGGLADALGFPSYDYTYTQTGHYWLGGIYSFKFSNYIDAQSNIIGLIASYGPYPTQTLFTALEDLQGLTIDDFWQGTNGWEKVQVVNGGTIGD